MILGGGDAKEFGMGENIGAKEATSFCAACRSETEFCAISGSWFRLGLVSTSGAR